MTPEEALAAARTAAAEARARGEYTTDLSGFAIAPTDRVSVEQLMEWAVIEPDESKMRSTRRLGAPITFVKRLMLRGLQQHFNELTMLQARFNLHLLVRMTELEDRVIALEREAATRRADGADEGPPAP
ncbi:MAG: hypothetical protein JWN65_452 [Solirubrobacterales bacterium]|jgi:hypothetical protein|nr:hypothetical protein [Solirubrobacterales bacterium]